jgi:hypothetical protein
MEGWVGGGGLNVGSYRAKLEGGNTRNEGEVQGNKVKKDINREESGINEKTNTRVRKTRNGEAKNEK